MRYAPPQAVLWADSLPIKSVRWWISLLLWTPKSTGTLLAINTVAQLKNEEEGSAFLNEEFLWGTCVPLTTTTIIISNPCTHNQVWMHQVEMVDSLHFTILEESCFCGIVHCNFTRINYSLGSVKNLPFLLDAFTSIIYYSTACISKW